MQVGQLGDAIGEEVAGEFGAAREGYIVLGQNVRSLSDIKAESWVFYALFHGVAGGLVSKGEAAPGRLRRAAELLHYSFGNMTTVGTGDLELHPTSELIALVVAIESIVGPILLGLFGFTLGNRLRRWRGDTPVRQRCHSVDRPARARARATARPNRAGWCRPCSAPGWLRAAGAGPLWSDRAR